MFALDTIMPHVGIGNIKRTHRCFVCLLHMDHSQKNCGWTWTIIVL